jgi:hypothetical protein
MITEQVFAACQHDCCKGLDSIMLAPTRELVADLNRRARTHRLADSSAETAAEVGWQTAAGPVLSQGLRRRHGIDQGR